MSEQVQPAHCCERCGGESVQSVRTDDGDSLRVCARCEFVVGEEMTAHDKLVRELWRMSDDTGSPRPEDVKSVVDTDHPPPETYEIAEPSEMEAQDHFDRDFRLAVAIIESQCEIEDQPLPENGGPAGADEADTGRPPGPEFGGEFVPDSFF